MTLATTAEQPITLHKRPAPNTGADRWSVEHGRLRPGEEFDGETTRLGSYACRLWLPMLRAERSAR